MPCQPTSSWLRSMATGALTLLLCGAASGALGAQAPTLGELAKKEQERRKDLKAAGKVYSNKDLPKAPVSTAPATSAPGALPPPTPAPDAAKEAKAAAATPPAAEVDEKNEEWWRGRMMQAREAQRRGEAFAEALQSRINALSIDAVNRDDPYQRAKAADDRQKAVAELGRVTSEIEQARKDIVAIEEEARQSGAPPGWIR